MNKVIFPGTAHNSTLLDGKPPEYYLSNPNLLINEDFQTWQRKPHFTVSRQRIYTTDRWIVGSDDGTVTVERSDGLLVTCTEAGLVLISQVVSMEENNLCGQIITLAADCEYTPGLPFSLCLYCNEGNGFYLLNAVNLTVRNTLTLKVPENTVAIVYELSTPPGQFLPGQIIRLKHAKLELGPFFTGWHTTIPASELLKCQRYYQVHDRGDIAPENLSPPMRAAPVVYQRPDGLWAYEAEL